MDLVRRGSLQKESKGMDLVRCGSLQNESDNKLNLVLHGNHCSNYLRLVSYNYSDNDVKEESLDTPPVPEFVDRGRFRFTVVGSCDGLLLVVVTTIVYGGAGGYVIYIWNPLTGEYKTLPQLKSCICENNVFGFGRDFTTESDDINYKVLFLETFHGGGKSEFKVNLYTTRTNSWNTQLPDIPFMSSRDNLQGMILAYDSLHHIAEIDVTGEDEEEENESIISFDLKDDKFRVLPIVPESLMSLCALKGDLCAFSMCADMDSYKLWKMENFGFKEQERWTIMFSINSRAVLDKPITFLSPLHLLDKGEILLTARYKGENNPFIISYHTENKKASFLIQGSEVSFPIWSVPVLYEKK